MKALGDFEDDAVVVSKENGASGTGLLDPRLSLRDVRSAGNSFSEVRMERSGPLQ